ncbi:2-hydroxy-3-keto-5-methylthiopentenyl-1-phosphate phosphatase [Ammoniphilus sp. CFH 90114]|uniref:2-hydroxy-3-keto-5-methylthiopentenyl-1- phosphate phosphatase n=1 Tax=Ammoniphilus sp. CFH 90114 TaxID=2493665 RepID=UPI00100DE85A|nr:2-hydroxy-3-keto-5-methylthiopentenyl-1-phosphate phosphatase [Ammoniphilus sp. CFH 90114]RXT04840.1 2-hydroxy-3-keto-5-methylthiopentenyl-1-phosphate phosphatase [Ammoniphilus sp. CFH 90114]
MTKQLILFCDFDGTITEKDNIVDIMREFSPQGWEEIVKDILDQRKTIRTGVGELFSLIPSSQKEQITQFVLEKANIRAGFQDFVTFTEEQGIKLLITSGGIDFFIHPMLEHYGLLDRIYCNSARFDDPTIQITWPNACDEHCDVDCGMCKTSIIRSYPTDQYYKVVIGDSITDLAGAKIADHTIARSFLKQKCEELGLPYSSFETFHDVIDTLKRLQQEVHPHSL